MKIYGHDCRTGKRSAASQKIYEPVEPDCDEKPRKTYYQRQIDEAIKLSIELKKDPNHPLHGSPKTDRIHKENWCMCEKCAARRELLRSRNRVSRKYSSKKGNTASRKKTLHGAMYNEFGEMIYSTGGIDNSYKDKSVSSARKKRETGKKLSKAIAESGYTRGQVAKESGISAQTLSRMCRRDEFGSLESWLLVCETLGISISCIVED